MKKMIILVAAVLTVSAIPIERAAAQPPVLTGDWESAALERSDSIYATRSFHFEGDQWSVVYRAYADSAAQLPLFSLNVGGVYVLGDRSPNVDGAYEGIFPAKYRHLVAESDQGVRLFRGMGCKIDKGAVLQLVTEGCGFLPGLMQAMGEYDLVSIRDGLLFLGDRQGNLTKARPNKLTGFPLQRR